MTTWRNYLTWKPNSLEKKKKIKRFSIFLVAHMKATPVNTRWAFAVAPKTKLRLRTNVCRIVNHWMENWWRIEFYWQSDDEILCTRVDHFDDIIKQVSFRGKDGKISDLRRNKDEVFVKSFSKASINFLNEFLFVNYFAIFHSVWGCF